MNSTQLVCPQCGSTLNFGTEIVPGTVVECLICSHSFHAAPVAETTSRPEPPPAAQASPPEPETLRMALDTPLEVTLPSAAHKLAHGKSDQEAVPPPAPVMASPDTLSTLTASADTNEFVLPTGAARSRPSGPTRKQNAGAASKAWRQRPRSTAVGQPWPRLSRGQRWLGAALLVGLLLLGVGIGFHSAETAAPQPSGARATDDAGVASSAAAAAPVVDTVRTLESAAPKASTPVAAPVGDRDEDGGKKKTEDNVLLQRKARPREVEEVAFKPKEVEAKPPVEVKPRGKEEAEVKPAMPPKVALPPVRLDGKDPVATNQAIERGVKYLRANTWIHPAHGVGYTALGGLTLLECGVPANDPMVQRAAEFVRAQAGQLGNTYEISLSILFLDRLGQPADHRVLQGLGLRLLAGQNAAGGWTYQCPLLPPSDMAQLYKFLRSHRPPALPNPLQTAEKKDLLKPVAGAKANLNDPFRQFGELVLVKGIEQAAGPQQRPLAGAGPVQSQALGSALSVKNPPEINLIPALPPGTNGKDPMPAAPGVAKAEPAGKAPQPMRPEALPQHLRALPVVLLQAKSKTRALIPGRDDNSNTHFALLALWVARRHDVPTEQALLLAQYRFQQSQAPDGHWDYHLQGHPTGPAMTAVGLLGLAMGHGAAAQLDKEAAVARVGLGDPGIQKGLQFLSQFIGSPVTPQNMDLQMRSLYFLWAVERVAMLYDLKTIGGKDWYTWGSQVLLANQRADGSWLGFHYPGSSPHVDTCFALLFLKRSNLVQDLTENLRLVMPIRDDPSYKTPR